MCSTQQRRILKLGRTWFGLSKWQWRPTVTRLTCMGAIFRWGPLAVARWQR